MILFRRQPPLLSSFSSTWRNKTLQIVFLVGGLVFVLLSLHLGFTIQEQQQRQQQQHHQNHRNGLQPPPPSSSKSSSFSRLKRFTKNEPLSNNNNTARWSSANVTGIHHKIVVVQHDLAPKNRLMFPQFKRVDYNNNPMEQQQQQPVLAPTLQSPYGGAFVHMGKTGGSAISLLLRNGCHSWMPHPCREILKNQETIASRLISSYYHSPDFPFLQQSHHDFYTISIRDPMNRFISAFCFEHLQNRLARHEELLRGKNWKYQDLYVCFPTLERYVSYLKDMKNSTDFYYPYRKNQVVVDSCRDLARASFHGHVRPYIHLYFNYQRIQSFIPDFFQKRGGGGGSNNTTIIYVIRQEHLWDDWKSFNQVLLAKTTRQQQNPNNQHDDHQHDNNTVIIPQQQDHAVVRNLTGAKIHQPVTRDLSADGYRILCHALEPEYQAYFAFLSRAQNLQPGDVQETIQRAQTKCPNLLLLPI